MKCLRFELKFVLQIYNRSVALEWIDEAKKAKAVTQNETDAAKGQA